MKIVFLDIDGVLNYGEFFKKLYKQGIRDCSKLCDDRLKNLQTLINKTNAKIVLSSTWRIYYPDGDMWEILMNYLKIYGLHDSFIGMTPRLHYKGSQRGDEIQAYLGTLITPLDNIIIIDDDSDMKHLSKYLVKCDNRTGFTKDVLKEALRMLN